jgi:hypothetical protein
MNIDNLSKDELKELYAETEDNINRYFNQEQAIKRILNSIYGAFGNEYFYFFNIRHNDSGVITWWTFPILVKQDALYIFSLSQGKQQKKMEKYIKATGKTSGEYTMDNEPFKNYCEKHLKKRKAFKLKRIK